MAKQIIVPDKYLKGEDLIKGKMYLSINKNHVISNNGKYRNYMIFRYIEDVITDNKAVNMLGSKSNKFGSDGIYLEAEEEHIKEYCDIFNLQYSDFINTDINNYNIF